MGLESMTLEQLGRLLAGTITCAVIILVLIIVYFVAARRSGQPKPKMRPDLAKGNIADQRPAGPSFPPVSEPAVDEELSAVDIGARLAGTGREAWLQEAGPPATVEEPVPSGKEILRLVRDLATGQTWIKVAGVRYRSLSDIRDRVVGERVLAAITYALRFSNGRAAADQGATALALPPCDSVKMPAGFGALSEAHESGEMLRFISDPIRHDFCIQVADHCYHRLVDVHDQATGQLVLEGITRLLQFSNGMLATNGGIGTVPVPSLSVGAATSLPAPSVPPPEPQPSASPAPALLGEQERFLHQLVDSSPPGPKEPVKLPNLISSLRGTWRKSSSVSPSSLNLVAEINRIFQDKLRASPLAQTDAEVEAGPDGGVRIRVGADYYDTPDDVPDGRLRELLKLSIAEWEQS